MYQIVHKKISSVFDEFNTLSSKEKWFIFYAMICAFFICGEYAIVRPVSNSLFIHNYSSDWLPYAWLLAVPINLLIVSLYNRYLAKWGCTKMFIVSASAILLGHLFCLLYFKKIFLLPFIFYIWKEIYILLMLQQLWSVIHTTIKMNQAKYLYGLLFGVGGMGSFCGSLIPGFYAKLFGSESLLYFSLPIYLLLIFFYRRLINHSEALSLKEELPVSESPPLIHGIKLILQSKFLRVILLLVVFMQISATFIDFQFNHHLQQAIPEKDLRTEYFGKILSIVHFSTITMQFLGSFLILHYFGLKRTHLFIPITLVLCCLGSFFFPAALFALSFIAVKSFDFSLFGVVKEILYVPLKTDEKFRAKAIIDVFAYRTSKSLASLLILLVQFLAFSNLASALTWMNLIVFACWITLIAWMFKHPQLRLVNESNLN